MVLEPLAELVPGLDPMEVGGKAASMGLLLRLGLPVPTGWVIPASVLAQHLVQLDLARHIEGARYSSNGATSVGVNRAADHAARQVRAVLLGEPLPSVLERALSSLIQALPVGFSLAVRSSAIEEATANASFAGQFATYLGVDSLDVLRTSVKACWASLWSASALRYRAALGSLGCAPLMGIVVQTLVPALAGGATHVSGDTADVEAVRGLGAGLMSGLVAPDRFRIGRSGQILETSVALKNVRAEAASGNVIWQPVTRAQRATPCIDLSTAHTAAELAFRVSDAVGGPVDLEWAVGSGTMWALQWRPSPECTHRPSDHHGEATLRGIPAAPGAAVGKVRIVHDRHDMATGSSGDVVVTAYFAPQLASVFKGVAIVTEAGGTCSHGSVIARERGIPVVVSVASATRKLSTGMTVQVDGTTGTITVLS